MIVVLSDLRRPEYLRATLEALDAAGARGLERLVVADADQRPLATGWPSIAAPKPAGAWRNANKWTTWAAFGIAAARGSDLLFFEDDVLPCPRAVEYAEALAVPDDCAWVSLYAPWGDASMPYGIWRAPCRKFTFCQALKIPHRTLVQLVARAPEMARAVANGSDECMAIAGAALGWRYGTHYPGLFQHVGDESSVAGPGVPARTSRAWAGGDFDAMTLRRSWQMHFE